MHSKLKKIGTGMGSPYRVIGGGEGGGGVNTTFHWQCMDFVAVMLFNQEVFHLECLFLLLPPFDTWDCVAYKSIFYKKACNIVF